MKKFISDKITNLFNSFSNSNIGYSGKKLSAFDLVIFCITIPMLVYTYWAYKKNDWSLLPSLLTIISGLVATLWGVNVWDKNKNGSPNADVKSNE